jgi:iron complex outermembrane recepter protein
MNRTFRCNPTKFAVANALGAVLVLGVSTSAALAQDQVQRVEVTGSAIKQIDAETSVPVTIIKMDDLQKQGITSIEQVVNSLTVNQTLQGTSQSVGLGTGGASFANLRGLGQNKTLVLLNGRRISNNAIDGSAPDLNMIPFAALQRVEVLRDGASALYGTDAIGGVINFITRNDYKGATLTIGKDKPKVGGESGNFNVGFGVGDLAKSNYNIFGFFDYQKQLALPASDRPDLLARSVKTSPSSSPGQYNQGGAVQNPSFPGCGSPDGIPLGDGVTDATCGYLYARKVDLVPRTERTTAYIKGTFQLAPEHQLGVEYFNSFNTNATLIAGVPYGALWMNPGTKYYPGNGITPLPTVFALNPAYLPASAPAGALPGVIKVRWRDTDSGGRAESTNNRQDRFIVSLNGTAGTWDYKTGLTYNENTIADNITGGYTDGGIVTGGVLNGTINPFGPQDGAGSALLQSAATKGNLFNAAGKVLSADFQASTELGDWFHNGKKAAIALGAEHRNEQFNYTANAPFAALVVNSTGFDPAIDSRGQRDVDALFAELNMHLLKNLEVTGAVRYDRYSDFGSTTNPKVSFRYQPKKQLLFRGSYSTGFRAPSLYDLNAPQTYTNTANNWDDPIRCPGGVPIAGASKSDNCAVQFMSLTGGNKKLNPETSNNATLGVVFEPTPNLTTSVDLWMIQLKHQILALQDVTAFGDPAKYAALFHRAPDGSLATDGSLCPGPNCGYVELTTQNLGGVDTNGVDLSALYRLHTGHIGTFTFGGNGTYVNKSVYQNEENGPWFQNLGAYSGQGPIFRWQHTLTANWTRGIWGAGLVNHYKGGYVDEDPTNTVGSYMTWDAYGTWRAMKGLLLTAGVRNMGNKMPPYSNQSTTFQVGYDPRFADPFGRVIYLRANLSF